MKKTKLIGLTLFSLFLLSTLNFASAAPPTYVGLSAGQEYTWTPTINFSNINTTAISLVGQDNWTLAYNMLEELLENETGMTFDMLGGLGLRMIIHNVTDELVSSGIRYSGAWFNMDVSYSAGIWTRVVNATDSTSPMLYIINPADINETTYMYLFDSPPIVMPVGLNYDFVATQITNYFSGNPYYSGNMSMAVQGNGFQLTINGDYLEMMLESMGEPFNETSIELENVIATVRYNSMGILEYASVSYGGLTLASASLSEAAIPGFEIPLFLGISAGTLITIIVIVKKKTKITI